MKLPRTDRISMTDSVPNRRLTILAADRAQAAPSSAGAARRAGRDRGAAHAAPDADLARALPDAIGRLAATALAKK